MMVTLKHVLELYLNMCGHVGGVLAPNWYLGNRYVELALVACVFTLVQVVVIRYAGFQARLRRARGNMVVAAYHMLLYWRRPRAIVSGEMGLLWNGLKFFVLLLPSLAIGGLLFAGMWSTLSGRYGHGPLSPKEEAVVRASVSSDSGRTLTDCDVSAGGQDLEVTAKVRIPAVRTVWTRVKPGRAGLFCLDLGRDHPRRLVLNVATRGKPVMLRQTVNGVEVTISYPVRRWWGLKHGWLVYFLAACFVAAPPLGRLLGTRLQSPDSI
jgi:hypothetical protein